MAVSRFDPHGPGACVRCGEASVGTMCSMFNTDDVCLACKKTEEAHPDYEKARAAETAACRRGDYNFPGIGLPGDLKGARE